MHHILLVIVVSLHIGYSIASPKSIEHGSHNLFNPERTNSSIQRAVRCTPCEQDARRPISNHLDPEYRGNGADNLGYDWSSMAWGGPAFPRKPNIHMGRTRGRDGKMMTMNDQGRHDGNVICDTCRAYWDGSGRNGEFQFSGGRDGNRGRPFDMSGDRNFADQQGYWPGSMRPGGDFETRVMSPTVGVLVKPGSRIAYIPSRSGEMFWDGVSGGGTRWDGFSNGISWVGNNSPEWDRSDSDPRDRPGGIRPGNDPYNLNNFGSWNDPKRPENWRENSGRDYYFTNGVPNNIDPQWRDRGYASNWHYGSTNQNGWNGNNMKWNYGDKQWSDNDRAANRFYFNSPQDRTYGLNDGQNFQYGNQYPNYQIGGYPSSFRPQAAWPTSGGYRPNDRFPSNFPQDSRDKDRPWGYNSRDPYDYKQPGLRPVWARPGPSYSQSNNFVGNGDKYYGALGGNDKYYQTDKNDYEKPWNGPTGYGSSRPSGPSGSFPYGGNRYPESGSPSGKRPNYPANGGHLFTPNDENRPLDYPSAGLGGNRPSYSNSESSSSGSGRPSSQYPDSPSPSVTYTGGRPGGSSAGYPGDKYPTGGVSLDKYPEKGGSSGRYPSSSPSGGYPDRIGSSGAYPDRGGSSETYPDRVGPSGTYPNRGDSTGGYPNKGGSSGQPTGYPLLGGSAGGYPGGSNYPDRGGSSGQYPSYPSTSSGFYGENRPNKNPGLSSGYPQGGSSYPSGINRPEGYPSGSGYPSNNKKPGDYQNGGVPNYFYGGGQPVYPSGGGSLTRPSGYPTSGRPSYFEMNRPGVYPSSGNFGGSRPTGYPFGINPGGYEGSSSRPSYPISGSSGYPDGSNRPPSQGNKNSNKGYYTGFITEITGNDGQTFYNGNNLNYFGSNYPGDRNFHQGNDRDKYYNRGGASNSYSSDYQNRYPAYSEDRISGGSYFGGDNTRGSDKFYYGGDMKNKYPNGYPSNHRFPSGNPGDFDRNQGSSSDNNAWNYGSNERKDGIYRRSGGSYPPYRGGQYYTSSYLASMSTPAGSTQAGTEQKTQSVTKADEVTESASDSS